MSSRASYLAWKAERAKNPTLVVADRVEYLRAKVSLTFNPEEKAVFQKELDELLSKK